MVARLDSAHKQITQKQLSKFERLMARICPQPSQNVNLRAVLNLSSTQLDAAMTSVLSKGLNFAMPLRVLPIKKAVCGMELAVRDLPDSESEEMQI